MQKWNIQRDRAQRVDEKNGVICLVIMFAPGVTVIKMSKIAQFLLTQQSFYISTLNNSQTVTPKPINHTIFWRTQKDSLSAIECFA